ncbi:Eaa protein, partial [Enterobacter sp. PGRG2]
AEMARRLLAVEGKEPVAYMYRDKLHADARFSLEPRFGNWSPEDINEYEITETKLYTAPQPAPVAQP